METKSYSADNGGVRHDDGKTQYHLIPSDGLSELARVYMFGAKKYSAYNWERGMDHSRVFNSLLRHLYAYWDGETRDQETGLHHMAHAAWNAIALLVYSLRGIGVDDRKASLLSAQQNKEAGNSLMYKNETLGKSVKELREEFPDLFLSEKEIQQQIARHTNEYWKGKIPARDPLPGPMTLEPVVTNPYALKRRRDLKEIDPLAPPSNNMRCYNCPNDALPHHTVCADCLQEAVQKP